MNRFLSVLCAFLFCSIGVAKAGNENGNGGDAVVCRNAKQEIISAELLDYYEARVMRGITIELNTSGYGYKILMALDRIKNLAPLRYARYRELADKFSSEAKWIPGIALVDIPDSQETFIPRGCAVEQVAVQARPRFPEDSYYTISKDIWDKMDDTSKAGLILHEIIYREALAQTQPHTNSIYVRYFNSYISSKKLAGLNVGQYFGVLQQAQLRGAEKIQGVIVPAEDIPSPRDFNSAGFATALRGKSLEFRGQTLELSEYSVGFYPSGALRGFTPKIGLKLNVGKLDLDFLPQHSLLFYEDGTLMNGSVNEFDVETASYRVHCGANRGCGPLRIEFYDNSDKVETVEGYRENPGWVEILQDNEWYEGFGYKFNFDEEGMPMAPILESEKEEDISIGLNLFKRSFRLICPGKDSYSFCGVRPMYDALLKVQGLSLNASGTLGIWFYPSQKIRRFVLRSDAYLRDYSKRERRYPSGSEITLDENELVESNQ
jgi:hypothetical protein